ncbi:MAG: hypothetical protein L6265_11810, partial [Thermoplasmatales archaeon]|nr:hypothetical protein [Thermoplasmatales archaeon]
MRKGRIACVVIFVLIVLVLSSTFFVPNPSVKAAKTINIIVNTPDSTIRARADGYAVYNLSITDDVTETLTLDAASPNGWEMIFLNESGVPITSIVASPTITYVYLKVHVPAGTANGTSDTETVYANNTTAGSASAVLTTTCELFGVEAVPAGPTEPHAIMGTVNHTNGSVADGAFVLLINM